MKEIDKRCHLSKGKLEILAKRLISEAGVREALDAGDMDVLSGGLFMKVEDDLKEHLAGCPRCSEHLALEICYALDVRSSLSESERRSRFDEILPASDIGEVTTLRFASYETDKASEMALAASSDRAFLSIRYRSVDRHAVLRVSIEPSSRDAQGVFVSSSFSRGDRAFMIIGDRFFISKPACPDILIDFGVDHPVFNRGTVIQAFRIPAREGQLPE
jgi:hypothetical protein